MRWLRLLLLGLALAGAVHAAEPPRLELSAAPAWKGWARPGRATEVDVRITGDAATRATLELTAGRHTLYTQLPLQPGRSARLHLPAAAVDGLSVAVSTEPGTIVRRDLRPALSESPLLAVALASGASVELDGFHTVAVGADDLPRYASAHAAVDALVIDADMLGALDARQMEALVTHASACGRIALVGADERVRRLLDSAAGCGRGALVHAASPEQGQQRLADSLATGLPAGLPAGGTRDLPAPSHSAWERVAVGLATYLAVALLAFVFLRTWVLRALAPVLATLATLALARAAQPDSQLAVWAEAESGAAVARYQAWQSLQGGWRERMRVPVPSLLGSTAQPCAPSPSMRLEFDAVSGRTTAAEFDSRLFQPVRLCFAGSFPVARAVSVEPEGTDGRRRVRNTGPAAWPAGRWIDQGRVHGLDALPKGATQALAVGEGRTANDGIERTALSRLPAGAAAALWALDLGGLDAAPAQSTGWLLMPVPSP